MRLLLLLVRLLQSFQVHDNFTNTTVQVAMLDAAAVAAKHGLSNEDTVGGEGFFLKGGSGLSRQRRSCIKYLGSKCGVNDINCCCENGGLALTPTLYLEGYPAYKDVECIPNRAFCHAVSSLCVAADFIKDIKLEGLEKLQYVDDNAFEQYAGKIEFVGAFPALKRIDPSAFNNAGTVDSIVDLSGAHESLEIVGNNALYQFKGVIKMVGNFTALREIEDSAFHLGSGSIDLSAGAPMLEAIRPSAFRSFKGPFNVGGALPKLTVVGKEAFSFVCYCSVCNDNTNCAVDLSGAAQSLEIIDDGAFTSFNGKLIVVGSFPFLSKIGAQAFDLQTGTNSLAEGSVNIMCRGSSWEGLEIVDKAPITHVDAGEKCYCYDCNAVCAPHCLTTTVTTSTTTATASTAITTAASKMPTTATVTLTATTTMMSRNNSAPGGQRRRLSAGGISAVVIVLLAAAVLAVACFKGWVQLLPSLIKKNQHMQFGNTGGEEGIDGVMNDPLVADMFLHPLSINNVATAAIPITGATTTASTVDETCFNSKFVARQIRLGRATQAAAGLADLMGFNDMSLLHLIDAHGGGTDAIVHEINANGTEEDQRNLQGLLDGTYTNPPNSNGDPPTPEELAAQSKTINELMQTNQVQIAKLLRAHVLALRLYTTSTFASLNKPLRADPPTQPHPFAATTYFVSQGIKLLRSVAGELPNAHDPQAFWRGMKDLTIGQEFLQKGGTEFACMSTSTSQETAIDFAQSTAPMVIKLETKDFMSRGADISFLSVYPGESETLFPPLTFLRPLGSETFVKDGKDYFLVRCEPVIP